MTIKVCIGEFCHLQGAEEVVRAVQSRLTEDDRDHHIELVGCFCMNKCSEDGVSIQVDDVRYTVLPQDIDRFLDSRITIGAEV